MRLSHHVSGWEAFPLQAKLSDTFDLPIAVDNDANAGALGEFRFGAGEGCRSLLYVTISTGIGGGWILDRAVHHGFDGMAGEIGHMVVNPGGLSCACGKRGCLEAEACGPAIAERARQMIKANSQAGQQLLKLIARPAKAITAKEISQVAEQNELARQILETSARFLGKGLGNAISLMNPQRIVLGGGVTKAGELWWQTVQAAARQYTLPESTVNIVPAQLGDDAPLWGAVALAEQLLA